MRADKDNELMDPKNPNSPYNKYNWNSPYSIYNPFSPHYQPSPPTSDSDGGYALLFLVGFIVILVCLVNSMHH